MKNSTFIYSDLVTGIKTAAEAQAQSCEIDALLESIFQSRAKSFDDSLRIIGVGTAKKIREVFLKNNLDSQNRETIRDFLVTLKEELTKFKIIKLTIAFEPSEETIENICNWVKANLGSRYILDIHTDKNLLGGAIIVYRGQYRDLTVKKALEEVFKTKKEEIAKLLHC